MDLEAIVRKMIDETDKSELKKHLLALAKEKHLTCQETEALLKSADLIIQGQKLAEKMDNEGYEDEE